MMNLLFSSHNNVLMQLGRIPTMSRRVVLHARLPLLLGVALLLAACGMKGDLYLEPDEDEDQQAWIIQPDTDRV